MKKVFKKIGKILLWILGILLLLLVVLYFLIQTPRFQTWATQKVSNYLEGELGAEIMIGAVDIEFPMKIVLEDIYIEDQEGHELLHVKSIKLADFNQDEQKNIQLGSLELIEPHFYLEKHKDSSSTNMQFILDYVKNFTKQDSASQPPIITCNELIIENGQFRYNNFNKVDSLQGVVNFNHILLDKIDFNTQDIFVFKDSVNAEINLLTFEEKSGLKAEKIEGNFVMNNKTISLHNASIHTNESKINGELILSYKSFKDFSKYNDKVRMNFDFENSEISTNDIAYFSSPLKGINKKVVLDGVIKGKVKNLKGKNLDLVIDENTFFNGDIAMNGLPQIDETFISLKINHLKTSKNALEQIPLPPFGTGKKIQLPTNIADLGKINFKGNFTGFTNDFVAYGTLFTNLGAIRSDISLKENKAGYSYNGSMSTLDFNIGKFYNIPKMGIVNSSVSIQGNGFQLEDVDANIKGEIQSFTYNDYDYKNILVDGNLKESFFDGKLNINDDNLAVDFNGKVDFTTKIPEFSFAADIQNIDFVDLNFINTEKYASLATKITANARGKTLESLQGDILMEEVSFCKLSKEIFIDTLELHSKKIDDIRTIDLKSSLVSGQLKGKYNFGNIQHSLNLILADLIPSYEIEENKNHVKQNFKIQADIHNFDLIQNMFLEDIAIAPKTRIDIAVNEESHDFSLIATSDSISIYGVQMTGTTLDTRRQDSAIYFTLMNDDIIPPNNIHFGEFSLDGRTEKDTLFTALEWNSIDENHSGEMAGRYVIRGIQSIDYFFEKSYIAVNDDIWKFNDKASINLDSSEVRINNFRVTHLDENMEIHGVLSKDPKQVLSAVFNNIELENLNPFINSSSLEIFGKLDGTASIRDIYKDRILLSDFDINQFYLNQYLVGDLTVESNWDQENSRIKSFGKLFDNGKEPVIFDGYYSPKNKENPFDIDVAINHFDLEFLNELIPSVVSDIGGAVTGEAKLTGKPEEPIIEGELTFENASVHVDYLNTSYSLQDKVIIDYDMFMLNGIKVYDQQGNDGFLVGTILHDNYKTWNFDLFLDISEHEIEKENEDAENKRFLCLNTGQEDNSLYYGKAYASGYVGVSGGTDNLEFDINLRSERGTKIALPLGNTTEVSFGNFVTFIDRNALISDKDHELDLNGISLKFDLEITPDVDFEIIFDEAIGDVIKGKGFGKVNMLIDTRGKFEMFGNVELTQGDYLFTLQNLISKHFDVVPGGTIQWFGDPLGANINLETMYRINAPLYDLLGSSDESYKSRTEVELIMNLDGDLMTPLVTFDIELPNVDDFTRNQVNAALNSEDELNRQAFGLIALRSFFPSQNIAIQGAGADLVGNNTAEFLSNQVSNWLSQISDDFDLGFNYTAGDDISNQEIALALSTQLFNDRLSLSGNFGVSNGTDANQNTSSLIGDLRLEYKLLEDGKVRMVVYNKSNDFEFTSTNQTASTQGVGVLYQEEFDNMTEFYCGFRNLFKNKENQVNCP